MSYAVAALDPAISGTPVRTARDGRLSETRALEPGAYTVEITTGGDGADSANITLRFTIARLPGAKSAS